MDRIRKKDPQRIEIKGHELICPICNYTSFWTKKVQLNTRLATFFDLDWANKSATCYICSKCTHISWFLGD
ncbi:MAG: hypothetical protein M0P27_09330 [Bacteroidales bacterium]|nr:hypothetical protein [Bacteroidales bacterium]